MRCRENVRVIRRFSGGGTVVVDSQTLFVSLILNKVSAAATLPLLAAAAMGGGCDPKGSRDMRQSVGSAQVDRGTKTPICSLRELTAPRFALLAHHFTR